MMKIDRHNYEEFFILYMDNELSSEDRREVEAFVQLHPDLKDELDLLQQFKVSPDTNVVFAGKEELMKMNGQTPVSLTNYEEWFVQYIDDELTDEQKNVVEKFVAENPSLQKELSLLQQTKLQPEEIVFTNKESLYRSEEKVRPIVINWRRVAVAAVLLLGIGFATFSILNKKKISNGVGEEVAKTNEQKSTPGNKVSSPQQETKNNEDAATSIAEENNRNENEVAQQNNDTKASYTTGQPVNSKKDNNGKYPVNDNSRPGENKNINNPIPDNKKDDAVLATNDNKQKSNNLPSPVNNPNIKDPEAENVVALSRPDTSPNEKVNDVSNKGGAVTIKAPSPSDYINTSALSGDELTQNDGKKNKLRGFFRKVTRTFEKRTNIDATEDDKLLVAGLAIKLK